MTLPAPRPVPTRRRLARAVTSLTAVLSVAVLLPFVATAQEVDPSDPVPPTEPAPRPPLAKVSAYAVRIAPPLPEDIVSIYDSGALDADTRDRAFAAARQAGAQATVRDAASIGMTRVERGGATVQAAPAGYSFPMGTTVMAEDGIRALMGGAVVDRLGPETIVMGSLTASLRGAVSGDQILLVAGWGSQVRYTISVVDDTAIGGTELLMTPAAAARIGLDRDSSVVLWGFERAALDRALVDQGLISTRIRVRRSWDPPDPDDTLGMAQTKALLGEFSYRPGSNGSVAVSDEWRRTYVPDSRRLLNSSIAIRARCHTVIEPALRAAFAEVAAAGVGYTFNVSDANTAGGCYAPRFNRLSNNSSIGFLSRHTWAMAIDTNTRGSCQGCAPPDLDCRAVRIFRKHGFAWGGNFLTPDGMHFEWVGERRDLLPYPSRFCRNEGSPGSPLLDGEPLPVEETERATIFADSGLVSESD